MGNYSKDRLTLIAQGIAGNNKVWFYNDTGAIGNVTEQAGFVTDANDMGMDTGDFVFIKATDGGANKTVRGAAVLTVQDTGSSQGTLGTSILVGDTS